MVATTLNTASTPQNPTIGANYYSSNTNKNPYFWCAGVTSLGVVPGTKVVFEDATNGDQLRTSTASITRNTSLYMWKQTGNGTSYQFQNGMSSGNISLGDMTLQWMSSLTLTTVDLRYVFKTGSNYYISSATTASPTQNAWNSTTLSIGSLTWSNYDPATNITTIGTAATPLIADAAISEVGVYYDTTRTTGSTIQNNIRYINFDATAAIPEPSTGLLLGIGAIFAGLVRRNKKRATDSLTA